ncbi:MAG: F0F1 ATP synthase subunit delta [Chloroflexi bacterium]|nr:F0F1 ATP synthase subunit delta [Chloroflexota bacterium]
MQRTNIHALRFAEAAFAAARDADQLDAWVEALDRASSIYANQSVESFLTSPVVPVDKKCAVLDELLPQVPAQVQNFLVILAHRERLGLVPEITAVFHRLVNEFHGIEIAQVTTAVPIDERERTVIAARLSQRTGKQIAIEAHVDPAILGGVIAQIGDDVIDDSVRGRLERLHRAMTA